MLRVPEHYAHFGAHAGRHDWSSTAEVTPTTGLPTLLRKVRKVLLWGVVGAPALLVMAVWQFVDPVDPNCGQEQRD